MHRITSLDQEILEDIKRTGFFPEKGFFSSSDGTSQFEGNVSFVVYSRSGCKIEGYSSYGDESEVLFKSGTDFKVLRMTEKEGMTEIVMIEK